jgi:hypothetical protein
MHIAGPYWQTDPDDLRRASRLLAMRSRWSDLLGRKTR